jgi:tripartite-type tricarboxylate transporter receptor subunit TctC
MKKLLLLLTTSCFSSLVLAQTVIEVVWPFSISSPTTNYIRHTLDQANSDQKEYKFILVQRVGAGGSVAANYVRNSSTPALLATSNAFFIRPYLFSQQSYTFDQFVPLATMGSMPMTFLGRKEVSWDRLTSKDKIFIGVPGLGSFSHVLAYYFQQRYPQTVIVPYQGPTEAMKDVIAGNIDLSTDVPVAVLTQPDQLTVTHITGSNTFGKFTLLSTVVSDKFAGLTLEFFIVAPSTMDPKLVQKFNSILTQAHKNNQKLQQLYKDDFVTAISVDPNTYYRQNIVKWKGLTQHIHIEK